MAGKTCEGPINIFKMPFGKLDFFLFFSLFFYFFYYIIILLLNILDWVVPSQAGLGCQATQHTWLFLGVGLTRPNRLGWAGTGSTHHCMITGLAR
jgi:hypothetical protein